MLSHEIDTVSRAVVNPHLEDALAHRFHVAGVAFRQPNFEKFRQNPPLGEFLLSTGNAVIVEASPVDRIWGIGLAADDERATNPLQWRGENLLGFALMEVRDRLGRQ